MIKPYLTVLTAYLPASKLNTLITKAISGLATALQLITSLIEPKPLGFFLLKKPLTPDIGAGKLFKLPTVLLILFFFLLLGPHTNVLANWDERVVPDNQTFASAKITDAVSSLAAPVFTMPVNGPYISTYFSRFHQGIDLPNPYGSIVNPIAAGEVVYAGWSNLGYGNMVVIRHELGYESLYAHLSSISVKEGDSVAKDSIIGLVGSTGVASGNHLHLELHLQGEAINPLQILK